jgi:outer membrane protein assembly factor BamB
MRYPILTLAILLTAAISAQDQPKPTPYGHRDFVPAPERPLGFRGDGSGYFPGSTPVTVWDEASGKNIVWKSTQPYWGHGEPVVVGDRVFIVQELDPDDLTKVGPELVCLSLKDGSELWRREFDHLSVFPAPEREALTASWLACRKALKDARAAIAEHAADVPAAREALLAIGLDAKPDARGRFAAPSPRFFVGDLKAQWGRLEKAHLWFCGWSPPGDAQIGATISTPVCDGTRLFIRTGYHSVHCFDLDGQQRWTTLISKGDNGGAMRLQAQATGWVTSPVLADGKVILYMQQDGDLGVVALDAATGAEVWRLPKAPGITRWRVSNTVRLKVDGRELLWVGDSRLIDPHDGTVVASGLGYPIDGPNPAGRDDLLFVNNTTIVGDYALDSEEKRRVFTTVTPKPALMGVALHGEAGAVRPEIIWQSKHNDNVSPVLANGLLFQHSPTLGVVALDPRTGEVLGHNRQAPRACDGWNLAVAGGYLFMAGSRARGEILVFSADRELRLISANCVQGDLTRPAGASATGVFWRTFPITFAGNRIVLRAWRYVYCIGDPAT